MSAFLTFIRWQVQEFLTHTHTSKLLNSFMDGPNTTLSNLYIPMSSLFHRIIMKKGGPEKGV